jgi:signal transduction histidine kinase
VLKILTFDSLDGLLNISLRATQPIITILIIIAMLKDTIITENELERIGSLISYGLLHTQQEAEFDQITQLAAQITGMPIALISLVDREEVWFKSTTGMDICSADRKLSFCSYAIEAEGDSFILEDIRNNPKFSNHPYANLEKDAIQFYAGVCLVDKDGHKLGTLCVLDNKPNTLTKGQLKSLQTLAKQVMKLIELHQANRELRSTQIDLERKNAELKSFAGVVSHDMKMPLANIIVTTDILKAKYADQLDDQAKQYLKYLKQSSFSLSDYITGLLEHYESDHHNEQLNQEFDVHQLLEEIVDLLNINFECEINFPENNVELKCNRAVLEQILLNLLGNSLKYNDKAIIIIDIACQERSSSYYFKISDNGMGIPKDKQDDIFILFSTVGNIDRQGNKGNGIGLSTVKKLVESFGGSIDVTSNLGQGTAFEFTIAKNNAE